MTARWVLRGVMTGFAVVAILAVAGRAAPAESFNGVVFAPPPAQWHFAVDPNGWGRWRFNVDDEAFCEVKAYARRIPLPQGDFRAWFDRESRRFWDGYKQQFGGSEEIFMDVWQGTARDGSEILAIDEYIDTSTVQVNFQMVSARKYGFVAITFVAVTTGPLLNCWYAAEDTMESIGGGYDLHSIPITDENIDKEGKDFNLRGV